MPHSDENPTWRLDDSRKPTPDQPPGPGNSWLSSSGGADGEGDPEYLTTGWSVDRSASVPLDEGDSDFPVTPTVWNTGVYSGAPPPGEDLPTVRTPGEDVPTTRLPDGGLVTTPLPDSGLPSPSSQDSHDRIAAVWRGTTPPTPTRRARTGAKRARGWALLIVFVVAVAAVVVWTRAAPKLTVLDVQVNVEPAEVTCGGTAKITAVVRTNGGAGTIRYRWLRSDGTDSGVLEQSVPSKRKEVRLPLQWTFQGQGTQKARAIVDVTAPSSLTSSAAFTYRCR